MPQRSQAVDNQPTSNAGGSPDIKGKVWGLQAAAAIAVGRVQYHVCMMCCGRLDALLSALSRPVQTSHIFQISAAMLKELLFECPP